MELDLCVAAVGMDLLTSISGKPKKQTLSQIFRPSLLSMIGDFLIQFSIITILNTTFMYAQSDMELGKCV